MNPTTATARPSHLQRPGDHQIQAGDYTGRRQQAVQAEADERQAAREKLADSLLHDLDARFVYVKIRDHIVPVEAEAYAEIVRLAR